MLTRQRVTSLTNDRPDPLVRLDITTQALRGMGDIFATEEPLEDVLNRVAISAGHAIPNADAVTISVLNSGGQFRTAACTDDRMIELDKRQYAAGRGPSLRAAQLHQTVRATARDHRAEWPEFVEVADQAGIRAYLSVPLLLDVPDGQDRQPEQETVGSLNIYSYTAAAFDPFDEGLVKVFTTTAEQAILNARRWQESRDRFLQLETALTSRAEIDQAKGVLMALYGCTADEAFTKLVGQSQHRNIKLNQLARDFLDSVRKK